MRRRSALAAVALLASVAVAADPGSVHLKRPKRGFQITSTPFLVPAGADREWCEYRRLPDKGKNGFYASEVEIRMPEGGHHFVVWAYTGDVTDDAQFPQQAVEAPGCTGAAPSTFLLTNLFGMQVPNGRVRFPRGIATRIKPHQQVFLNPHLRNFGTTDMNVQVAVNMIPASKRSVKHLAESFAIGTLFGIKVPAHGSQTRVSEWAAPANLNLIQVSSHQHKLGTRVTIALEQADGSFADVFTNTDWEHPNELWTHLVSPWKDRNPQVIRLEQGRRMRITCEWTNPTDAVVHSGVKTTDEMCFATGYFYRDDGAPSGFLGGEGCGESEEGLTCPFAAVVSSTP